MGNPGRFQGIQLMRNTLPQKNRFIWHQGPALFWAIMIFILSSFSSLAPPVVVFNFQDKLNHFIFYGIFGIFLARAFFYQDKMGWARRHWQFAAVLFGVLYGISDEFHQYFVPGRCVEFWDVVADGLGASFGVMLFYYRGVFKRMVGFFKQKSE
ncbi:MAG TPA: hypothetical protein ENK14_06170 [Caldithrix sp.]|nr:hypothetical protein [Caldithrix sp.]